MKSKIITLITSTIVLIVAIVFFALQTSHQVKPPQVDEGENYSWRVEEKKY